MAEVSADADDCKARELDLLESGNFSDAEIVCGERSWKCHRAILTSRSTWFRKALSGPFEEASTRRVKLDEENPISVDLALKYIYGRGLDVESSVSADHFVVHCVSLWHTADFLLLNPLKLSVQKAIHSYCDKRLKELCTFNGWNKWHHKEKLGMLSPWALDLVLGIREAYKWNIEHLKKVLLEFIWAGRNATLREFKAKITLDQLKDVPNFVTDLIGYYGSAPWLETAVWAPYKNTSKVSGAGSDTECARCGKKMSWRRGEYSEGQVWDPFHADGRHIITRGWCRECGELPMIPWRDEGATSLDKRHGGPLRHGPSLHPRGPPSN